jgi:hypothetical protein
MEQNTLRQSLEAAIEEHEDTHVVTEQEEQRARDAQGRFAATEQEVQAEAAPAAPTQEAAPVVEQEQPQRPPRPSSWKKDYWDHWEKLDPNLAAYLSQREQEYAKGVSTYKAEYDNAKPLLDAITPFQPLLQQHNINPAQWINNLGTAHQKLVMGTPQEKLQMFAQLAQDYGVNLADVGMATQGQFPQGLDYINPLYQQVNQLSTQLQSIQTAQQQREEAALQSEIQKYAADTQNYPYFEQAMPKMAQLLEAGLADDLPSAYKQAVKLDDEIFQSLQEMEKKRQVETNHQIAQKAKANAVSVKSSTPVAPSGSGAKDRRSMIAEALSDADANV